jgi:hypothetical protein
LKPICLALILSLTLIATGQQSVPVTGLTPAAESRIVEVLKSLRSDNELRLALERGERGNGIRYAWMDKMQQLGIKQATYVVDYGFKDRMGIIEMKSAAFLREYCRYDSQIKDRKLLRQVRDSGLEDRLHNEILDRAHEKVLRHMKDENQSAKASPRQGHVTFYLNLLDDEALPILDRMPQVEW